MTWQEQTARIERQQAEVRAFVAEQRKLKADWNHRSRDMAFAPWQFAIGGMIAGAALFAAGMALVRLLSH
ncbi:hypothetical protein [Rhodopseudomonas palustris]|uniref:hypothetical protein n=1 Tax=Rhodopseudomonas palustris TaxID=1076 RepID=UPI000CECADDE|nr:hypothetical protein [Rhodopseudomonas palustris]PPQ44136.1 hypothetical protein CKO39_07835 [Rhodopseudomonas palustris]